MAAKWIEAVATVAPSVASILGGPLAGTAVKAIASAFGLGDAATEKDVEQAVLAMGPEQIVALRQADIDLQKTLTQAGIDLERIDQEDRADARDMAKATSSVWIQASMMAVLLAVISGCLVAMFMGCMEPLGEATRTMINTIVGGLLAALMATITFFTGSNKNSQQKDAMLFNSEPFNG